MRRHPSPYDALAGCQVDVVEPSIAQNEWNVIHNEDTNLSSRGKCGLYSSLILENIYIGMYDLYLINKQLVAPDLQDYIRKTQPTILQLPIRCSDQANPPQSAWNVSETVYFMNQILNRSLTRNLLCKMVTRRSLVWFVMRERRRHRPVSA